MTTCNKCGEEIEFRYVDGRPTPIHSNGWCRGSTGSSGSSSNFERIVSYLNANAYCPVCGASVYFYQSPHGGRVFFDDVGWPWPKHPCTDNPQSQTSQVKQKTGNFSENVPNSFFRDREGRIKELFFLIRVEGLGESFIFILQNPVTEKIIRLQYSKSGIEKSGLRIQDFREAPSFVAEQYVFGSGELQLDFICIRLKKIIKIKMKFAVTSG